MENIFVNDSLRLFAFRIDVDIHSPYIAVRQIDCAILRTEEKTRNKRRISTEQAQRAQIRQILLNINLKSEKATREEITHLKNAGILGKRAPSCSLLNAEDAVRLLMAFGKEDIATDLAKALSDYRAVNPLPDGTIRPSIDPQAIAPGIRVNFTSASYSGTEEEDGEPPAIPRSTRPPRQIVAATPLYTPDYDSDSDEDGINVDSDRRKRTLVKRAPRPRQPRASASPTAAPATTPAPGPSVSMMFSPLSTPASFQQHSHTPSLQQHAHGHAHLSHLDSPSAHLAAAAAANPYLQSTLFSNPASVHVKGMSLARPSPKHASSVSPRQSAASVRHTPVTRHTASSTGSATGSGFRTGGYSFHDSLGFMNTRSAASGASTGPATGTTTGTTASSSSLSAFSTQPPSLLPSSLSASSSLGLATSRAMQRPLPNPLSNTSSRLLAPRAGLGTPLLGNNFSGYSNNSGTLGALTPGLSPAHASALTPKGLGQAPAPGTAYLRSFTAGAGAGAASPAQLR